jgi:DNA-binding response OmpR family regulator
VGGMIRILVVDDEKPICDVVRAYLEREGYAVSCANDGEAALEIFRRDKPDLVVLDRMLPKLSGEAVCVHMRAESSVPIIMLTARAGEDDLVAGLSLGADDYVEKPFRAKELVARIAALLRRTAGGRNGFPEERSHVFGQNGNPAGLVRVGSILEVDPDSYEARCNGVAVSLTSKEFRILAVLAGHPKKTFTREELISGAFPEGYDGFDRAMDTYVKNIRKKLAETDSAAVNPTPEPIEYIRTVHGVGYRMGDLP